MVCNQNFNKGILHNKNNVHLSTLLGITAFPTMLATVYPTALVMAICI